MLGRDKEEVSQEARARKSQGLPTDMSPHADWKAK